MASRMKTFFPALFLVCTFSCPIGPGMAGASSLHLEVRGSLIEIQTERVPLIDILKAVSDKTGIILKSGDSMADAISCDLKAASVEKCIQRLLVNRNYALIYKKSEPDRFVPVELRVFGSHPLKRLTDASGHVPQAGTDIPPPEDPMKRYQRTWFEQKFKDEKKLAAQISAKPMDGLINEMPDARGFRITKLAKNSVFQEIGLKEGDIIADVNGQPVGTTREFVQALRSVPEGSNPAIIRIERLQDDRLIDPIYIELR